jgi:hypothetical protein
MPETQQSQAVQADSILIVSGSQPDWISKAKSENLDGLIRQVKPAPDGISQEWKGACQAGQAER